MATALCVAQQHAGSTAVAWMQAHTIAFDVVAGDDVVVETRIMPLELDPESSSSGTSLAYASYPTKLSAALRIMMMAMDLQMKKGVAVVDE